MGDAEQSANTWRNWSGWVTAEPLAILQPESEDALRAILRAAERPVRVAGAGHSFPPLCATPGTLLTLDALAGVVAHDPVRQQASVGAGTRIHDMGLPLYKRGLGLINQGDIDRQAIAGAVGTGTHGTGRSLGNLSSAVTGFRVVTGEGDVVACDSSTDRDLFDAARVSVGVLGVFSELTLQCREKYKLAERTWTMDAETCMRQVKALSMANRHFEFFWFPYADKVICKALTESDGDAPEPLDTDAEEAIGDVMDENERLVAMMFETAYQVQALSPLIQKLFTRMAGSDSFNRYGKAGKVRWSHEAFPSTRGIRFNEMEYAVPIEDGTDCVQELVEAIRKKRIRTSFPIEFRTVAADDIWLSPFYKRDSVTISIHQYYKQSYKEYFDYAEQIFRLYDGRPHWGKLHGLTGADFRSIYPRWDDFQDVRRRMDPSGVFLNDYLRSLFEPN